MTTTEKCLILFDFFAKIDTDFKVYKKNYLREVRAQKLEASEENRRSFEQCLMSSFDFQTSKRGLEYWGNVITEIKKIKSNDEHFKETISGSARNPDL